jgi:four helix bundle protein
MNYEGWEGTVPASIRNDALWRLVAYRKALFLSDLVWCDVTKLVADRRTLSLADQLCRAVGSVGANLAEGYSRGSAKDRVRFFEYSLGSARESRDWYFKARHVLGAQVFNHRSKLLEEIIRLLLTIIPKQRNLR